MTGTAGFLGLASVAAVEIALRIPLEATASAMLSCVRRIVLIIRSPRISDTHKERVLPVYALRLGGASIRLFGMLCAIAAPVVLVGLLAFPDADTFAAATLEPWLLAWMVVLAAGWLAIRRGLRHGS